MCFTISNNVFIKMKITKEEIFTIIYVLIGIILLFRMKNYFILIPYVILTISYTIAYLNYREK